MSRNVSGMPGLKWEFGAARLPTPVVDSRATEDIDLNEFVNNLTAMVEGYYVAFNGDEWYIDTYDIDGKVMPRGKIMVRNFARRQHVVVTLNAEIAVDDNKESNDGR